MPRLTQVLSPVLLMLGLAGIAGCNSSADNQQVVELARVRTASAVTGPAAPSIRTNGLLANEDEIRLSFKVGGVIRRLSVTEGEQVRKGQKLAEIEQAEIDAQVEQAAQAQEKARRDLERGERLYADKVISLEQLQDLRTHLAVNAAA
jgi:membrane fusion protein, multidrug efflux system